MWGINYVRTLAELGCLDGVIETDKNDVNELKMICPEYKFFIDIDLGSGNIAKIVGWINEK